MTTVPDKTKKAEDTFKLRLKGGQPKLSEVKANTSLGQMNAEAAEKRRATIPASNKDDIDISI